MTQAEVAPTDVLAPGTVLGDRFEIGKPLGKGAMGAVYHAVDQATEKKAAVKVLHKHLIESREYVARFKREARAAARFRHDAAVRVLGTGQTDDGLPYIAMELVEGKSLKEVLAEDEAPMSVGRASNIIHQLLGALGAAHHQGIVHRDMKPDNVRVYVDEDGIERPKILDFGVAKFVAGDVGEIDGGLKTKTGVVLGTPKYMSPEQIRGEVVDGRSDIYAVGAMYHEMLVGVPPFEANDVFGFVAMHLKEKVLPLGQRFPQFDIPPEVDEVVLGMLAKDPQDRPSDAGALGVTLKPWAVEDPRAAEKGRALRMGTAAVMGAGVVAAGLSFALAGEVALASSAAGIGLGGGAAWAAKSQPRPSVYGYVKRLGIVAGALAGLGLVCSFLPGIHPVIVASHCLAALLSYVAFLLVWPARATWARFLAAGVAAPLLATLLLPIQVSAADAPVKFVPFVKLIAGPEAEQARMAGFLGVALVGGLFGLACMLLPRPRAARL